MFAKVYQYKFPGVSEAKVAASYCSDKLGKKIVEFDFEGLNIMIGKDCLLYTSPSPRDVEESRMPSSA